MQISSPMMDTMASILGTNHNGGDGGTSPESAIASVSNSASGGAASNLPQALHNLQRLLQSQMANVSPLQLQQVLQRQQVGIRKQIGVNIFASLCLRPPC
jgi:hypothetical protein